MLGRFKVRPEGDGDGWGVWDGGVNGWRAKGLASEVEAGGVKADLDVQFDARGPRAADQVRTVDPARPVEYPGPAVTGTLDCWIRDAGQWLGRVTDPDGRVSWVPGDQLRPSTAGRDDPTGTV